MVKLISTIFLKFQKKHLENLKLFKCNKSRCQMNFKITENLVKTPQNTKKLKKTQKFQLYVFSEIFLPSSSLSFQQETF